MISSGWLPVVIFAAWPLSPDEPPREGPGADAPAARFDREIRPILEAHCFSCHGPEKQKSGLRLDSREAALRGGDVFGPAILPGNAAESPFLKLVEGKEEGMEMPLDRPKLPDQQIALLRAWIEQGAPWGEQAEVPKGQDRRDWWSFRPIRKPDVAALEGPDLAWARNPIDRFIRHAMKAQGLEPAPEAGRRALIRRASFDLTGLPPSPEEIDAFAADPDPGAYERLVDRLLASPRYGERWARHWLDVAHYGDTHGYDKDKPRPNAWPYRDYVIRALNEDKPYGRFVREQVAGDAVAPGTTDGIVALGFLAAGPWDFIGHAELPETKTDGMVARNLDRDDVVSSVMNAFCSLTVQCARCHNHKFDPVTQEDYYSLQAVFAAIDRTDRAYDPDPSIARRRMELASRQAEAWKRLEALGKGPEWDLLRERAVAFKDRVPRMYPDAYGWHGSIEAEAGREQWVQVDLGRSVGLDRVVLQPCHDNFAGIGDGFGFPARWKLEFGDDPEFASGVRVLADRTDSDATNPGVRPISVAAEGQSGRYLRFRATKLAHRQRDYIVALAELRALDAEGKDLALGAKVSASDSIEAGPRWGAANLTDGLWPGRSEGHPEALDRLAREVGGRIEPGEGAKGWDAAWAEWKGARRDSSELPRPAQAYVGAIHHGEGNFLGTGPSGGKPRPIHVLTRGDVKTPGKLVGPGTVAMWEGDPGRFALDPEALEAKRREALAGWLVDPRNPLTWRSAVNRIWHYHFGRGLSATPNDFGHMGQPPTHPELLDWLAAEFRDGGQSLKRLHRLIVTSATYRQSSASTPEKQAKDPSNLWLARMPRRKLEAEAVRDSVLLAAGALDLTMYGPGFRDFAIDKPEHSPHYEYHLHDPNDPVAHRRSIYRFLVRSQPQPLMNALDCADPSASVDRRNQTLTPPQALALWNDGLMLAMARRLAERAGAEERDVALRPSWCFRRALGRAPDDGERATIDSYAKEHGLPAACRLLFNLNEFIFVD
jgi:mono/diheme cytochrome c family protein